MRVMTNHNPHSYQQQKTNSNSKDKNFADMLAGMAANKHGKPEAAKDGAHRPPYTDDTYSPMRLVNPHRHHGTESKLKIGQLVLAKEPCTAELVEDKIPEPTYPNSIYALSHDELKTALLHAERACRELDTGGMSKGDIYSQIESIFQNYLGKDFREPQTLHYADINSKDSSNTLTLIQASIDFQSQLIKFNVGRDNFEIVRDARGYSDMSESEMHEAVRSQYPENMTLKDCILMGRELRELGLEDIYYGEAIKDRIFATIGGGSQPAQKIYGALLDMPANFDVMKTSYDDFVKNDYYSYPTYNTNAVFDKLISWFSDGASSNQGLLHTIRDILDEMEKGGVLTFNEDGYCVSL